MRQRIDIFINGNDKVQLVVKNYAFWYHVPILSAESHYLDSLATRTKGFACWNRSEIDLEHMYDK